jgi:hypothetical protein
MRHTGVCGHGCAAVLAVAVQAVPGVARGDTAPREPIRLSVVRTDAANSCPDARVIAERVRERLGRDPFAESAPSNAEVTLDRSDTGPSRSFVARVRIRDSAGVLEGERDLESDQSCDTLASAVALALALFVDPQAALRPSPAPAAASPAPASAAPASPPVAPASAPSAPLPGPQTLLEERQPPPPHDESSADEPSRGGSASLGAFGAPGLLPGLAWGARITADVAWGTRLHVLATGFLAPEQPTSDQRFAFGLSALGLGGCVDALMRRWLQLGLCPDIAIGEIHAIVYALSTLQALPPGGRPWATVEAQVRGRLPLYGPLFAELSVGVFVPLVRYGFSIVGQSPIFQQGAVIPTGDMQLGLHF